MVNIREQPLPWIRRETGGRDLLRVRTPVEPKPARRQRFQEPAPSELAARFDLLEQAAVFYMLPERVLRALARRMRPLTAHAGDVIVRQGEQGSALFFVQHGHCQVRLEGPGHAVAVATLGRADFFGWPAVMDQPAAETVVALDDCELLVLDATAALNVLGAEPGAVQELDSLNGQRAAGYAGIAAQLGWGRPAAESVTVAVYSPKGGSGRTTLALNVAGALARRHPGDVLLLDISFPFTQAALLAGLAPVSSLAKVADAPPQMAEELLLSAVLFHPASLMVLPGCIRPEEADLVTPEVIGRAMEVLKRTFRYVIVDLGVAMDDLTLAVLDQAQHVLLVTPPELAALKAARDAHDILTGVLGYAGENISVVLNSRMPRSSIRREAVERRLSSQIAVEVGYDGSRPDDAALEGAILSLGDRPSEIAKGSRAIADLLESKAGGGDRAGRRSGAQS